ncbi:hypothetical protein COT42_05010 [Candidatus Saganbacteria bacterium CG08_land_8_20_14_0_20_45_16]|uniref:Mechanosensitive ion channel protein MscS n=1 Tax=Candidatus Saganbacteria bacterium CG08_land_8_20_14_0_20_45_16 TaxID=2014293 RepID=A0A2H0XXB1_UNCSA|nr:MAG: hypothetical protein COT42_05010 [Candidatus Saganbacteria bacterium CG08_land_8_20_14_0_20_45_16]
MLKLLFRKALLSFLFVIVLLVFYFWFWLRLKAFVPQEYLILINRTFFVVTVLAVFYFFQKSMAAFFDWYKVSVVLKSKTLLDDQFLPLFSRTASVILWSVCLVAIFSYLGININAILATLGVGSLAIALAAQDTIANLIAGFLIMIDRPFMVGDTIKLPAGQMAKVLEIGIRRSKFLGDDKGLIIVPNVDLSKNTIVNYSARQKLDEK